MNPILVIIVINLAVFLAVQISPQLISYLSLPPTFDRPWAVITSMFVHAEFFHIFANMITLYFFGSYLYRLVGQRRFLLIYFGGGILGSIFFILLTPPISPSAIGASGAVFALGGALAVIRPNIRVFIFPLPVPVPLWIAVISGFLILSFIPGIAWEAHLGGLAFGLATGYLFKKTRYYF